MTSHSELVHHHDGKDWVELRWYNVLERERRDAARACSIISFHRQGFKGLLKEALRTGVNSDWERRVKEKIRSVESDEI